MSAFASLQDNDDHDKKFGGFLKDMSSASSKSSPKLVARNMPKSDPDDPDRFVSLYRFLQLTSVMDYVRNFYLMDLTLLDLPGTVDQPQLLAELIPDEPKRLPFANAVRSRLMGGRQPGDKGDAKYAPVSRFLTALDLQSHFRGFRKNHILFEEMPHVVIDMEEEEKEGGGSDSALRQLIRDPAERGRFVNAVKRHFFLEEEQQYQQHLLQQQQQQQQHFQPHQYQPQQLSASLPASHPQLVTPAGYHASLSLGAGAGAGPSAGAGAGSPVVVPPGVVSYPYVGPLGGGPAAQSQLPQLVSPPSYNAFMMGQQQQQFPPPGRGGGGPPAGAGGMGDMPLYEL